MKYRWIKRRYIFQIFFWKRTRSLPLSGNLKEKEKNLNGLGRVLIWQKLIREDKKKVHGWNNVDWVGGGRELFKVEVFNTAEKSVEHKFIFSNVSPQNTRKRR